MVEKIETLEEMRFPLTEREYLTPSETTLCLSQRLEHYGGRNVGVAYNGKTRFNQYGEIMDYCGVQSGVNYSHRIGFENPEKYSKYGGNR